MIGDYTISSRGTCIPSDKIALIAFKLVQKEANRFLDAQGKSLLACDGKIGKNTVAAVNSAANMFPTTGILGVSVTSCKQVADKAGPYMVALKAKADQHKLAVPACPSGVIQKITNPEPTVEPDGTVVYDSPMTAGVGGVPYWLIAVAGLGGLYYLKKQGKI